jgi:hypothetical protein
METTSDWFFLVMGLSGGLAIFLLGMDRTVSGLKGLAGNRLRWILGHLTGNRWYGAATGAGITAIIQSSSVTTVVVVGLVSAQAMTLLMSVGVIFGANVGTTITAQIIAFKVPRYALAVVAIGFAIDFFARSERVDRIGPTVMGLGLASHRRRAEPRRRLPDRERHHRRPQADLLLREARSPRRCAQRRTVRYAVAAYPAIHPTSAPIPCTRRQPR